MLQRDATGVACYVVLDSGNSCLHADFSSRGRPFLAVRFVLSTCSLAARHGQLSIATCRRADLDVREQEAAVGGLRRRVPRPQLPQRQLRAPHAVPATHRRQRAVIRETHCPGSSLTTREACIANSWGIVMSLAQNSCMSKASTVLARTAAGVLVHLGSRLHQ